MPTTQLPSMFLAHASDVLGDTTAGLSGTQIVRLFVGYANEYGVDVPHAIYPFDAPNKRTALLENLRCFDSGQQHRILRELCDYDGMTGLGAERGRIKLQLATKYRAFDIESDGESTNDKLIQDTRHWLDAYPSALKLYDDAIAKFQARMMQRNCLDDLRLALEVLLREVFQNKKSLENQINTIGQFVKDSGGSTEFSNMFRQLIDYYTKYQNSRIKHDDAVIEEEIEFVLEITSSFMRHIVRMRTQTRQRDG